MTAILKVDTIQDTACNNIINESSNTITIGTSGDTTNIVGTLQNNGSAVATTNGITMADQWRLTANLTMNTSSVTTISANLERNDNQFEKIGTGMTESSGIFTFPETGIYLILLQASIEGSSTSTFASVHLQRTLNNSSYSYLGETVQQNAISNGYNAAFGQAMMDVTDTTNQKVKLTQDAAAAITLRGSTNDNRTSITFIRLGDT